MKRRCRTLLLVLSLFVLFSAPAVMAADPGITVLGPQGPQDPTDTTNTSNTSTTPTTTTTPTSTTTTSTTTTPTTPTTPTQPPTSPTSPTGPTSPTSPTAPASTSDTSTPTLGPDTTLDVITPSAPTTSASASPSTSAPADNDSSSGFGTGSIIGLSVAGGVALLGLIGFFVWKFTRKNRSDFDDNEAIKWPELNAHGGNDLNTHPLPVNNTGRAGFDTGSDGELSRAPSATGDYSTSTSNLVHDPYAVPPLPHMNPNQPYHDDPNAVGGYYDPYRGPVPNTFHDTTGESIAMTQMSGSSGRMSPGPGMAYDGGRSMTPVGMTSPGRASPGPHAAYAAGVDQYGRASPAIQNPYGGAPGRASPGPQQAYGRSSPGPQAAYDPYGQRM